MALNLRRRAEGGVSKDEAPVVRLSLLLGTTLTRALPQQPQPEILRDVGVLVLVDQNEAEARLILPQHFRLLAKQPDRLDQEVAEIGGVEHLEPLLIGDIELLALAVGKACSLAGRNLVGGEAAVLPAVDQSRQTAGGPALLVDVLGMQHLIHQPVLAVAFRDVTVII